MALEKLTLLIEGKPKPIKALFNPQQIQVTRSGWSQWNGKFFGRDQPTSISLTLFFDTTLLRSNSFLSNLAADNLPPIVSNKLITTLRPEDVRLYTQPIYDLTRKAGKEKPPFCKLRWGYGNVLLERCFLKSVTKTLTHFLEDGTPVRATMNCTFEEVLDQSFLLKVRNPIDDPIRVVKRGETLSSIAAEEFGDPALWRIIATANQLDNPRQIVPGQRLTVPPRPADL
ncbi:MAG: LysM peptidoglycan-binding domain-containing protein [Leptolyngbya sp. Prado105]|jgi:hypothetical protein|nr:LysM peptidoglycan-binding domain-containing protein [Leptolyngbya sp. Prado105]